MKLRTILVALLPGMLCATAVAADFPQVQMRNTEVRHLQSGIVDYDYAIFVTLPGSYTDNPERIGRISGIVLAEESVEAG